MKTSKDYSMDYPLSQRFGGTKLNRQTYPNSEFRRKVVDQASSDGTVDRNNAVDIVLAVTREFNYYLFHQHYLRDMAVKAIEEGNTEDAIILLKRIGTDDTTEYSSNA